MNLNFFISAFCLVTTQVVSSQPVFDSLTPREQINEALKELGNALTAVNNVLLSINQSVFENTTATEEKIIDIATNVTTLIFDGVVGKLNDILVNITFSPKATHSMRIVALCVTVQKTDSRSFVVAATQNWTKCMLESERKDLENDIQNVFYLFNNITNSILADQKELEECTLGDGLCLLELDIHLDVLVEDLVAMVTGIVDVAKDLETLFKTDVTHCNDPVKLQAFEALKLFVVNFVWCVNTLR